MAGGEADIWVCGQCRSVNKLRAKQCYSCRTPQHLASVDPADIAGTGHGSLREIALPEFHASRGEAMLASALILLVAGMNIVSTVVTTQLLNAMLADLDAAETAFDSGIVAASSLSIATAGVGLLALTAWAYWLSRVVMAMPALGLGYPAANGLMAFVENYLPGLNLFRVPAIVRDVVRRVAPEEARGEALIFAAWIGLLGGFFAPRVGGFLGVFGADTLEGAVRNELLILGVGAGLVLVGAVFLVALIWWIEARIARRRTEQLEGKAPLAAAVTAAPVEAPAPAPAVSFAPAAAAPFAPAGAAPPAPFSTAAAASPAPAAAPFAQAAAPLAASDTLVHRPITAATGSASVPTPVEQPTFAPEPPAVAHPTFTAEPPAVERPFATVAEPAAVAEPVAQAEPAPPHVPTGPRLHLRVDGARSMTATLDGESEPITMDELRATVGALARADGSATIATVATTFEARALAEEAFELFSNAGIPTTLED